MISKEEVEHIAKLARLELTGERNGKNAEGSVGNFGLF